MKPFWVYILKCADGSYYCGHTDDIDSRLHQHAQSSTGYVATRKPASLIWQGEFESRLGALEFETRIKGWSRAKKEALIAGDWDRVSALARGGKVLRQAQDERLLGGAQDEGLLGVAHDEWRLKMAQDEQSVPDDRLVEMTQDAR